MQSADVIDRDRFALHPQRRLFHAAVGSLFPVLALLVDREAFFAALITATVALVAADIARLRARRMNLLAQRWIGPLLRQGEESRLTGASYVLLGTLAAFALFQRDVAVVAVLFLAVGDPVAAMVGMRFRRGRLFGKSPVGSMAMVAAALGVIALLDATGGVGFRWPFLAGAVAAAAVEILPLPVNDNLTVPLSAGAAMALLGS